MIRAMTVLSCVVFWCIAAPLEAAKFDVEQRDDGVTVKLNGKLVARCVAKSGNKPIVWPIIGPYGNEITRQYPMRDALPDERADHPHHPPGLCKRACSRHALFDTSSPMW